MRHGNSLEKSVMNDRENTPAQPGAEQGAGAAQDTSFGATAPQSTINEPEPFTELENLHAENASLKDKVLRTLAEMENLRRRTEREIADAKAYGVTSFARDMLGVADNLRRALDHLPAEARES